MSSVHGLSQTRSSCRSFLHPATRSRCSLAASLLGLLKGILSATQKVIFTALKLHARIIGTVIHRHGWFREDHCLEERVWRKMVLLVM